LYKQAAKITLTSRAFHNTELGKFGEFITKLLRYDKFLPMNTGCEAVETACKLARRWAYRVKKVPDNEAVIFFPTGCYWGMSITARSGCSDPLRYHQFGPFTRGFELFNYNDIPNLEMHLKKTPTVAAVCIEPIQGEAGIIIPADGYLK